MISNLAAWSLRQLCWTEPPNPAQTTDQFFPLKGNNTFPESEETPGKITPLILSQHIWRGCTVFPSLSQCKHASWTEVSVSALRGSAPGRRRWGQRLHWKRAPLSKTSEVKGQGLPKCPCNGEQTNWINRAGLWEDCGSGFHRKKDTREYVWFRKKYRLQKGIQRRFSLIFHSFIIIALNNVFGMVDLKSCSYSKHH